MPGRLLPIALRAALLAVVVVLLTEGFTLGFAMTVPDLPCAVPVLFAEKPATGAESSKPQSNIAK